MKTTILASLPFVMAAILTIPAPAAAAQAYKLSYEELLQRVEQLEERLDKTEQKTDETREAQDDQRNRLSTVEQTQNDIQFTFDNGRPTIKSGDGRFQLALRARFHEDFASYFQDTGNFV